MEYQRCGSVECAIPTRRDTGYMPRRLVRSLQWISKAKEINKEPRLVIFCLKQEYIAVQKLILMPTAKREDVIESPADDRDALEKGVWRRKPCCPKQITRKKQWLSCSKQETTTVLLLLESPIQQKRARSDSS
mmetsp:Transcript_29407/g.53864  ORF Transcript_29407/g.53864 Transcript_29407/m.53864 type:complete len:133 (+) Transcript_29407:1170-1568(+)